MYIKNANNLVETSVRPLAEGEQAWIDLQQPETLFSVLGQLEWNDQIAPFLLQADIHPQMLYHHEVLLLSLAAYQNGGLYTLNLAMASQVLLTFHSQPLDSLADLARELPQRPDLLNSPGFLLYDILTRISDAFVGQMDGFEEEFDQLEEEILDGQDKSHAVFSLRRRIHRIRRVFADMRRMASRLSRRHFDAAPMDFSIFVDIYESFYHLMDNIDTMRDNLTGLIDLQLNQRSIRLNEVMKFLTVFSTIFLPVTFITGFLGMNLHNMPELAIAHGQDYTIALMVLIVLTMLFVFRRRGWF